MNLLKKYSKIDSLVNHKNYIIRLIFLVISCFIFAFNYNAFLAPNNIVVGGITGLALVVKELTGIPNNIFIYVSTVILIIIYYLAFGKERTINTIIGAVLFMIMISLTNPLVKLLNISFKSNTILIIVAGILQGTSNGMIYRGGFNTGGTDIIACLFVKYFKVSVGSALKVINAIIIISGALVFGFSKAIYAVLILLISTKLVDIVMLGINDSKMIFVKSKKWEEIESYLTNDLKIGYTEMGNKGGIFKKKIPVLLVIVPFHYYLDFKDEIIKIDNEAFISSLDCYMVLGGYKKKLLPF